MIKTRKTVIQNLPAIPVVEAYLQSKGWAKVTPLNPDRVNPNALIYQGGSDVEGMPLTIALPAHPNLIDAKQRLSEAIRFLAALEAKTPRQLVSEITLQQSLARTTLRVARMNDKRPHKVEKTSV